MLIRPNDNDTAIVLAYPSFFVCVTEIPFFVMIVVREAFPVVVAELRVKRMENVG